jgi:hypothetical protein
VEASAVAPRPLSLAAHIPSAHMDATKSWGSCALPSILTPASACACASAGARAGARAGAGVGSKRDMLNDCRDRAVAPKQPVRRTHLIPNPPCQYTCRICRCPAASPALYCRPQLPLSYQAGNRQGRSTTRTSSLRRLDPCATPRLTITRS